MTPHASPAGLAPRCYRGASTFAALVLAGNLAACQQAPPPPLSVDARVSVRPDAGVIVANPLAIATTPTGITRVSIELRNTTPQVVAVNCTTDWFDDNNQPIPGITEVPLRVTVGPYGAEFCATVSPSPKAHQFRVAVTPTF